MWAVWNTSIHFDGSGCSPDHFEAGEQTEHIHLQGSSEIGRVCRGSVLVNVMESMMYFVLRKPVVLALKPWIL